MPLPGRTGGHDRDAPEDGCEDHNATDGGFVQMSAPLENLVVDARGHRCPAPTLRLRRALERAASGQVVRLLADDPLARIDVPHFTASNGYRLLSSTADGPTLTFDVVRD